MEKIQDVGDSQGGSSTVSVRNPVRNDLNQNKTWTSGTVSGSAECFGVCKKKTGYEEGGRRMGAWCIKKAVETNLIETLKEKFAGSHKDATGRE